MEPDVLNKFYQRYQRELYLYLLALCGRQALAEDLLQETFLKALLSLPNAHTNARAWLYKVARNLYFDYLKKESRIQLEEEPERAAGPSGQDPLERLLTDERSRVLYQGLAQLEKRKREVLELQYFGGLSQREIAAILNVKPEYVRVLALRGRRELRMWMEEKGYDIS